MKCEEANQIDLVDYLNSIGYQPEKIRGNDYWYLSPFRNEREASFKVNRNKNVWYDHGAGQGGKLVALVMEVFHCRVSEALQKISFFHPQIHFENSNERQRFHLQDNYLINHKAGRETAIRVLDAKRPPEDLWLCRYLKQRGIEKSVAGKYCCEVEFINGTKEKIFRAIGFKNNAGGYELRNEYFKGSSSPKYITYLDKGADKITVFEGFFDFLSYQTLLQSQEHQLTSFLILNSTSFFERSLLLMEKHRSIHLFLDRDLTGKKCTAIALKRSAKFKDESKLYKGYKDLNDWIVNFGKQKEEKQHLLKRF